MAKWLAAFEEKYPEMPDSRTDNTDNTHVMAVLSVQDLAVCEEKTIERWNPELASQSYVWCLDCKYLDKVCTHPDNPFREQCVQVPRKCRWYEERTG